MIERLASLAALGPGLGLHSNNPGDLQDFAQRRVEHLREKVEAGAIDPQKLQDRLNRTFGDAAGNVVAKDGTIDFDKLQSLITTQQATKLQDRLEGWFGEEAAGIVGQDGQIDGEKFEALQAAQNIDSLQARLTERFGDRADDVIGVDGSVDVEALRELFVAEESARSYEPASLRHDSRRPAVDDQPFFDVRT